VQIKFTAPKLNLMNVASQYGFYFHHAKPTGYVLMCLWTDPATPNKIPAYADHYVGVGGVVINTKGELLLIQERRQPEPRQWKFPGGFMDPGETIREASEREVLEETGIKTTF
jgi:8-oxo-dGTP pyrophosphatase MutT (NUDIX family)